MDSLSFTFKEAFSPLGLSTHAWHRMFNRCVAKSSIDLCLRFGEVFYKTGIRFHVLSKKAITRFNLDPNLDGLCVLVSHDNTIITFYKNKEAISHIKRLSKNDKKKYLRFDA